MEIYPILLVTGLMFTLLSVFFGHLLDGNGAVGLSGHADGGADSGGVPGLSIFSPTVLSTFVTAFGAAGWMLSDVSIFKEQPWLCALISLGSGMVVAGLVLWLFNCLFRKTESSSEAQVSELIGQTAAITAPIPEKGVGEIAYVMAGSRYTAPARDEKGRGLPVGLTVRITRIIGNQFYVDH